MVKIIITIRIKELILNYNEWIKHIQGGTFGFIMSPNISDEDILNMYGCNTFEFTNDNKIKLIYN